MFKIKNPVLYIFLLKLKVIFDFILGYINKNSKVSKFCLKKALNSIKRKVLFRFNIFISIGRNLSAYKKRDKK